MVGCVFRSNKAPFAHRKLLGGSDTAKVAQLAVKSACQVRARIAVKTDRQAAVARLSRATINSLVELMATSEPKPSVSSTFTC